MGVVNVSDLIKKRPVQERLIIAKTLLESVLSDLSSAEPERKKGKWIYEGIRGRVPVWSCSVCGAKLNADWAIMPGVNFCPNCGARMVDKDE